LKSLMSLWLKLAYEMASQLHTSATMDCKTVQWRTKHEGLSFLTITLPLYGKAFEQCLDIGRIDPNLFVKTFHIQNGSPELFRGFLGRVFDLSSGVLLDTPSTYAIQCIRQLTLMFAKIDLPCSDARKADAMLGYVQCEKEMASIQNSWKPHQIEDFRRVAMLLFRETFSHVDRKIYEGEIVPKHGPGATADGLVGNNKFTQRVWTSRLEKYFPAGEYLFPSWKHYSFDEDDVHFLEPDAEIPVKVISVPKTQKTPRIIAMEPTAVQYVQQGLLEVILEGIRKVDFLRTFLGFDDQEPNQLMAKEGSLSGELATLDLSEASDRVSYRLVREMTHRFPHLREGLDATRSQKADVPGYGVISLSKYASMGSALCFPIEAMVFLTIIFLGIERELRTSLDRKTIKSFLGRVRVYGDDIIIPVEYVHIVIEQLEAFGFLVNSGKSFWTGRFRESCGKEYYNGEDVSIVRVRRMFPTSRRNGQAIISLVSLRNQLYWAGHWQTVKWLDERIKEMIYHFPVVLSSSPVLGRESALGYETQKIHRTLHAPLVKGYVVSSRIPSNAIDGSDALLKVMLQFHRRANGEKNYHMPHLRATSGNGDHLQRSGRPQSVFTKLRWSSPF